MTTKRALVLSGGGAKGCWQAGVMLRLAELGAHWDAYFGVSVGAINAAHMAQYGRGAELEGALDLEEKWHNFSNKDICRHHNRLLRWLLVPWKYSVYDSRPLLAHLKQYLDLERVRTSGKHVEVGAVSMSTGQYMLVNGHSAHFTDAVYSSAAFPVMFGMGRMPPPDGQLMMDGGLRHVTPLGAAIRWGATHVDVITLDPPGIAPWVPPPRKWYEPRIHDVVFRALNVIMQNIIERDLDVCRRVNRRVVEGRSDASHRYVELNVIRPVLDIPVSSLNFDPKAMAKGFQLGYDAVQP